MLSQLAKIQTGLMGVNACAVQAFLFITVMTSHMKQ